MKAQLSGVAIVVIVIVAVLIIGTLTFFGMYNGLVRSDATVGEKWGNVQVMYQRRADLIPNLVETVKGARDFEKETLTKITEMRSQAGQIKQQVAQAQNPADLQAAETQMQSVLARLLVVVEAYPDLKSNQNFLALQSQIEGTENRVAYARTEYNDAVKTYQVKVRSVPTNMIAGMFGFSVEKWKQFQAEESAQAAPKVTFK